MIIVHNYPVYHIIVEVLSSYGLKYKHIDHGKDCFLVVDFEKKTFSGKFLTPKEAESSITWDQFLSTLKYSKPLTTNSNIPSHYQTNSIDVIDMCKILNLNFNRGNILKYIARAGKKDDELKDLNKALDYLKREIKFVEENGNKKS